MYLSNTITSSSTSDSLAYLATKAAGRVVEDQTAPASTAHLSGGSSDPSLHVGLSVDALLVLSVAKEELTISQPALTDAERNNAGTDTLQQREFDAFGHYLEEGDPRAYYRAYIEYYDSMPAQDQASARYAGTREPAVAALRAMAYENAVDMTAPEVSATEQPARRATPIASIFHPVQADFENVARVSGRISRADTMYSTGF